LEQTSIGASDRPNKMKSTTDGLTEFWDLHGYIFFNFVQLHCKPVASYGESAPLLSLQNQFLVL